MSCDFLTHNEPRASTITAAVFLAGLTAQTPFIAAGLLLIDIAKTFQTTVGTMSQINTSSSTLAIFAALVMGALSVKYKHRSLLQIGLVTIAISAAGCYFADNYLTMLIVFSLAGIGQSMVTPMTRTLIGEYIPRDKQPQAIGWLIAGSSLSYLVGAPLMAYLTNYGGWRTVFLIYLLPVALLSLLVTQLAIPRKDDDYDPKPIQDVLQSFKTVLTDSSALACLLGSAFLLTSFQAVLVYSASFYREVFSLPVSVVSNIVIVGALTFTAGSVGSSTVIGRFGKRPVIIVSSLLGALLIGLYTNTADFWVSMFSRMLGGFFVAIAFSGLNAMMLDQVPRFRGTVMSLNSAIGSLGSALGAFIGGMLLLVGGYAQVGFILGLFSVLCALIVYYRSKEIIE
jgi:DHA1 family inner membrane transport protein